MGENDRKISLLDRAIEHGCATARYSVYYGEGRDAYDVRGRTAHESIFNLNDGNFRCPNSQQGYSPFSTWTRGLAWAMCGFAEQLEFLDTLPESHAALGAFEKAARATCDFYIENTPPDGIPYWDTGAPGLCEARRLAQHARRSVQSARAGGQLRRRDRRARPAAPGTPAEGRPLLAGRPDGLPHAVRRAVPQHRSRRTRG